ncbi:hypothetical protein E4634_11390 [Mangrovimicrobium sediminis]|uniref:Bacterial repeat domain-containing protein n=1 Tax=Mangrovimicrobium sediminis TaxID=2562682 RepID=A0A4Z0M2V9_9GAMM|nr:hypothetical protein [Haliea sp. SAOS-164]TGD73615.1 hypothetical protein E4634_11390 [Haliea sp. SAOS-164]
MKWMSKVLRCAVAAALPVVMSACRIQIDVPAGGRIEAESGELAVSCPEGGRCLLNVNAPDFNQTLIAVPNEGYEFVGWAKGEKHLFGGSTGPATLDASLATGNALLEGIVGSDEVYYLRPVFALEDFNVSPDGLPIIYQIDCSDCVGPELLDWPVSLEIARDYNVWFDVYQYPGVFTLATFVMYATESDYQIVNIKAYAENDEEIAEFSGLVDGQVIRQNEPVIFALRSKAPSVTLSSLNVYFEFGVAGTGATFRVTVPVGVGDRCPVC